MPSATRELPTISHYDLLEKIAEGGMGTVYKGRCQKSGELVAIKVLPPHLATNHVYLKRFEQEYNAAKALDHVNVVKALDYGRHGSLPFLVMEYVEGESLGDRLEREGRIPEVDAIKIIAHAAQGLHRAHQRGLIHRDVKPDNILLTTDGKVKLADMGLVKEVEADSNLTRTGRGLGTPHFMAPEQFRNAKNADVRCDIYSLAATLYHAVTGQLPFKACNPLDAWMKKIHNELAAPRELNPELSERVDWAIRRAMSPDPTLRPESCREFIEDLTGQGTHKLSDVNPVERQPADQWYLVYKDDDDVVHTVKGSKSGIRRSLREGLLGDAENIRISRTMTGPFDPLRQHPEYRDLAVDLNTASKPPHQRKPVPDPADTQTAPSSYPDSSVWITPVTVTAMPPPLSSIPGPHIDLCPAVAKTDWLKWGVLFLVALAAGLIGHFLIPFLAEMP